MKIRLKKNVMTYVVSLTASLIGILLNFILARVLEAEKYGQIQYLVALSATFSNFLVFGMNSFLIREASNKGRKGNPLSGCLSMFFYICIFAAPLLYYFLTHYVSYTVGNKTLSVIVLLSSILISVNLLITSYLQGKGKYHLTVILETIIPKGFLFLLTIAFLLLGRIPFFQANYLLFYLLIYGVLFLVNAPRLFRSSGFVFSKQDIMSIAFFFGVTVSYSMTTNLTKVLQGGWYNNATALGVISVSLSIVSLINVFTGVINNIAKPIYAKYSREKNKNMILDTYQFNTRMNSYIAVPFYVFFITQSTKFLSIFGTSYTVYPAILVLLSLQSMVSCLTGPNGTMLAMTGKEKYELINGLVYIGVYFLFAFLFKNNTVYGLCYSLLCSEIVVNIMKYAEVWILYRLPPLDWKTIVSIVLIILADGIMIYFLKYINSFALWLVCGIAVGCAVIALNFIITLYRKKDFKQFLTLSL